MNRIHLSWVCAVSVVLSAGCSKSPDSATAVVANGDKAATGTTATAGGDAASTSASSSTTSSGSSKITAPVVAAPDLAKVPADLMTAAYDYYGLGYTKPLDMQLTDSLKPGVSTGSQTISLLSVDKDTALFKIDHTGGLSVLGQQELLLKKDGIFVEKSSIGEIDSNKLELPNDLAPGRSWTDQTKLADQGFDITSTAKVVGERDISTKVAARHCLLVSLTGSGTIHGSKASITAQAWYSKGIGMVKSVISTTLSDGTKEVQTLEESK